LIFFVQNGLCLQFNFALEKSILAKQINDSVTLFGIKIISYNKTSGRRGRDRMVVGFSTTCAIQSVPITTCSWRGLLNTTLCDKVCQ
jgi:hypothetical protein